MITNIDVDSLVRFIQSSLASPELIDEELFRDEAVAYNDLCYELNTHLLATDRLIDAGRRDEAIEYSERNGNLLEIYERLDFPERELWCELVSAFELPLPPPLSEDSAGQLNDAYAMIQQLEPLLKRHRLLALDHAPLRYRLVTLVELAKADPLNPAWQDGVEEFQQARLAEIPSDLSRAMTNHDSQLIGELNHEIAIVPWVVPVPAKLKAQIHTVQQAILRRETTTEIEHLAGRLAQAHEQADETEATRLADQIGELMNRGGLQSDDPIMQSIAPGLAWVKSLQVRDQQQQRDQAAVDRFQRILNRATQPDELETALESIASMGSRFPAELRERGKRRLKSLKQTALIKRLSLIGGAIAVTLMLLGGIAAYAMYSNYEAKMVQREEELTKLVEGEKWEEAKTFYESQSESTQNRPVFSAAANQIGVAWQAEQNRKDSFERLVAELNADETGDSSDTTLNQLRAIARTLDEKRTLAKQEARAANKRYLRQQTNSEQVKVDCEKLQTDFDRLCQQSQPDLAALTNLKRRAEELKSKAVYASKPVLADASQLATKIDRAIEAWEQEALRLKAARTVTQTTGELDVFASAIRAFSKTDNTAEHADHWSSLPDMLVRMQHDHAWLELANNPARLQPKSASPTQINQWLEGVDELNNKPGGQSHFLFQQMKDAMEFLAAVAKQPAAIETLNSFAKSDLLQTMYVYIDTDPDRNRDNEAAALYYSPKSYETGSPPHIVNYYADYTLTLREKNFGATRYEKMQALEAGHSVFGKWLRENVTSFQGEMFAPNAVKLLDQIAAMPSDRTDPIFQLSLMRSFLKALLPASEPLQAGFQPILDRLENSGVQWDRNWFTPGDTDPEVYATRKVASDLLTDIVQWQEAKRTVAEAWRAFYDTPAMPVRWVGWWSPSGDEAVAHLKSTETNEELFVIRHYLDAGGESSSTTPISIGRGGRFELMTFPLPTQAGITPAVYAIKKDLFK